jgi:hypothetical protein
MFAVLLLCTCCAIVVLLLCYNCTVIAQQIHSKCTVSMDQLPPGLEEKPVMEDWNF